jgi:serine protease
MTRIVRSLSFAVLTGAVLVAGCGEQNTSENVSVVQDAVIQNTPMSFSLPAGVNYWQVATASGSTLLLGDRSQLLGATGGFANASASGTTKARLGFETKTGSVTVAASGEVMDRATINGSLTAGGTWTFGQNAFPTPAQGNVTVSGTVQSGAVVTPLQTYSWTVPFNTSTTNVDLSSGTNNLAPGSYASLNIQGGNLVLRAGTYYVDRITLEPNGKITADSSAGSVFVYVKTSFVHHGSWVATADKVLLGYLGTNLLALEKPFAGTVVAPNARVRYAVGATPHQGTAFAKEVELDPDVKFTAKPFSNWSALNFDVAPRFECYQTRSDGKIAAVFGYSNPTASTITVPVGANNKFTTGAQDRGQPSAFLPGTNGRAFAVAYTSGALSWTLNGSTASVSGSPSNPALQCPQPSVSIAQDTTVQQSSPKTNYGTATTLTVAAGKAALVSFDRASLKSQLGVGRIVTSATLKFNVASGTATNIEALALNRNFSESAATWNCSNDRDTTASGENCFAYDRWRLARRDGTHDNPWHAPTTPNLGTVTGSTLSFDVTKDLNRALGNRGLRTSPGWILVSSATASTALRSREAGSSLAPTLIIQTAPILDTDATVYPPLTFTVDSSLPVRPGALPPWTTGGPARPRSGVSGPHGGVAEFTEDELLVFTDDAAELSSIVTRWNATETFTQTLKMPGVPTMHILKVDLTKASPATLVANSLQLDNLPRGPHKVSSSNGMALLAIAQEELRRGALVGVNWVPTSAAIDVPALVANTLTEGPFDTTTTPTDSLTYDYLQFFGVPDAWKKLFYAGKLTPSRKVTILDTGYDSNFLDRESTIDLDCSPLPTCENFLEPDKRWHGTEVVNAGFGSPGNGRGAAGPGGPVSNLRLQYSYGDQAELLLRIPQYMGAGNIINTSHAMGVPAVLTGVNLAGEFVTRAARDQHDTLIFAAAGNEAKDVDATDCFLVCWEERWWFPCENDGVNCVGGTPGSGTTGTAAEAIEPTSNYGASMDYFGPGRVLTPGTPDDPLTPSGVAIQTLEPATSYATPFVAGIAALTWAADTTKTAGDVENCLSSTSTVSTAGGNHRVVNASKAVSCALGNPTNFPPAVQIVSPNNGDAAGIGINTASAIAVDFENGVLNSIAWSLNGTPVGSTASGGGLVYGISMPGAQTLTATASDQSGASTTATVTLSVTPAPPVLRIVNPASDGQTFQLGFPVPFVVEKVGGLPPACSSFLWDAWNSGGTPLFTGQTGCAIGVDNIGLGTGRATASLTQFGLTGSATRTATIVDDGKMHVKIINPLPVDQLGTATAPLWGLSIPSNVSQIFQGRVVNAVGGVTYRWTVSRRGRAPTVIPGGGNTVFYGPYGATTPCADVPLEIEVLATDANFNQARDTFPLMIGRSCVP